MMNCCTRVGCGKRSIELRHSDLPARLQPVRLSVSPAPRNEPRRALSPAIVQPPSTQTNVPVSQDDAQVAIFVEDDDSDNDNDGEEEALNNSRNSMVGSLSALSTKIIRRLSQKNQSKNEPYHSIGSSEEEVARRAELKRLMRKRIERELHSEDQEPAAEAQAETSRRSELPNGVGPRDALEFDIVNYEDAASVNHDPSDHPEQCVDRVTEEEKTRKELRRRSSCPTTPLRPLSPKRSSQRLREHVSLPQLLNTLATQPGSLSEMMGKTDSFHCMLPDLVPVVFEDPLQYLPKADQNISVEATTQNAPEEEEDVCRDQFPDGSDCDQKYSATAEPVSPGSPINKENIDRLEHDNTTEESIDETTPLDTWLRSQGIQPLSLRSDKTSSITSSDHLGVSCPTSSKESFDSKLHGLRLKSRPCKEHKMKLFPSLQDNQSGHGRPSHRILSPHGLQVGFLQSAEHGTQRVASPPPSSSRYTTGANSRDESPKPAGHRLPGQTLQAMRSGKNETEDKSDSSSYRTAFTNQENTTPSTRVISAPWWQAAADRPPTEPESGSLQQREAERSISTRFSRVRKSSQHSQRVVSRFREDLGSRKNSKENKLPVLAKIQSLLVLKPQLKKPATRIVSRTGILSVTPAPELSKIPRPGFTQSSSDPDFAAKKAGMFQRLLRVNTLKGNRLSVPGQDRAQSQTSNSGKKENDINPISAFFTLPGRLSAEERQPRPARTVRPLPSITFATPVKQQPDLAELPADETTRIKVVKIPSMKRADQQQQRLASDTASNEPEYPSNESPPALEVASAVVMVQCSASTTTGNIDTQKSQSSYEDCVPRHMLQDTDSTSNSSRIDTLKRSKSDVERRTTGRESRPDKFQTWHGIPERQKILLDSTLEFGAQLEQALADAKLMVAR